MFIIVFILFFIIFIGAHYYVFLRLSRVLKLSTFLRKVFIFIFLFSPFSLIIGRILERWYDGFFVRGIILFGSFWLAFFLYLFLIIVFAQIYKLLCKVFRRKPFWNLISSNHKSGLAIGVLVMCVFIVILGSINARMPIVRNINISIPKESKDGRQNLSILMVSDIHLGTLVGKKRLEPILDTVYKEKPDMVIFAGDTIDEDIKPVIRDDIGSILRQINAPLGFYGITGNHEYIGGAEEAVSYLTDHSMTVLRDRAVLIGESFYLVGREDLSVKSMGGRNRKSVNDLLLDVDISLPIIMLDHQPLNQNDIADNHKIDLGLSGHTHNGQLWPLNFITKLIYEIPFGYGKINETQFYTSSGYGTWGPPVRLGNRPEIVILNLEFQGESNSN